MLPKDVYLTGLSPAIEKIEKTPRRTVARSAAARPRTSKNPAPRKAVQEPALPEKDLDRVAMTINGYSRSDDAMLELVDRLYASPTFLDPELAFERRESRTGLVNFSISGDLPDPRPPGRRRPPGGALADAGGPGRRRGAARPDRRRGWRRPGRRVRLGRPAGTPGQS